MSSLSSQALLWCISHSLFLLFPHPTSENLKEAHQTPPYTNPSSQTKSTLWGGPGWVAGLRWPKQQGSDWGGGGIWTGLPQIPPIFPTEAEELTEMLFPKPSRSMLCPLMTHFPSWDENRWKSLSLTLPNTHSASQLCCFSNVWCWQSTPFPLCFSTHFPSEWYAQDSPSASQPTCWPSSSFSPTRPISSSLSLPSLPFPPHYFTSAS